MVPNSMMTFEFNISAISLSEKTHLGYIALWDSPYYSINVIEL